MLTYYLSLIDSEQGKSQFEKLYYLYRTRLFNVAKGVLKNDFDAEDALQNAFMKIALNIEKIDDASSPKTYYYSHIIVKNCALDLLRNKAKTVQFSDAEDEVISDTFKTDEYVEEKIEKENYIELIDSLKDTYRDVLILKYVYDLPTKKIAAILNRNITTVNQQIARGKKLLILKLQGESCHE